MTTKTCGDCIHADVCKQVNSGWFSPKNIAYCNGFKDRNEYVQAVRCKDCKFLHDKGYCTLVAGLTRIKPDDYCSYGAKMDLEVE